jgi:hypothetical protein
MGFADVHREKCYATFVLFIELVEGGNLPPERRSRVASEHEHYRLLQACEAN